MSLDYVLDRRVKLNPESEYKSLYTWSLQEFGKDEKPIGTAQIPWNWGLYFFASELDYQFSIKGETSFRLPKGDELEAPVVTENETIYGKLRPQSVRRRAGHYSMFGTGRPVEHFGLHIIRAKEGEAEQCSLWGSVSYTSEWDFENVIEPDVVQIYFRITSEKYDKIIGLIGSRRTDLLSVRLSDVHGFYSEWSPAIRTDSVKILANIEDQKVEIPEGCTIKPPTLGYVGEWDISFVQKSRLDDSVALDEDGASEAEAGLDEDEASETYTGDIKPKAVRQGTGEVTGPSLANEQLEKLLRRLMIPLWAIFAALVYQIIK